MVNVLLEPVSNKGLKLMSWSLSAINEGVLGTTADLLKTKPTGFKNFG